MVDRRGFGKGVATMYGTHALSVFVMVNLMISNNLTFAFSFSPLRGSGFSVAYLSTPSVYHFNTKGSRFLTQRHGSPLSRSSTAASAVCTTQGHVNAEIKTQSKVSVMDVDPKTWRGKYVFVRSDLNVPLKEEGFNIRIIDDTRIRASTPTIDYLIKQGAKVVISSHLGRPKGSRNLKMSLQPVADRLSQLLGIPVPLACDIVGPSVETAKKSMKEGDVLLLENIRYIKEETLNDPEFSKLLANGVDVFINDAFGTAHRAHSSTAGIAAYVPLSVSGLLLDKELKYFGGALSNPERPFATIIGGAKISSKIGVIEALLSSGNVDTIVIGGAMVFTFLKGMGYNIGTSLVEDDQIDTAKRIQRLAAEKGVHLLLPDDFIAADKYASDANTREVTAKEGIPEGWMGLDHGKHSTEMITDALKRCRTFVWNGPMGVCEFEKFAGGTLAIAKTLAELTKTGATTIVGGGDSVAAIENMHMHDAFSHVSTGGGASLELLEGKVLPGLTVLTVKA